MSQAAIIRVAIDFEQDVVAARQRARQIAGLLGFDGQDQTRIATAVSEIARNAQRYAGRGVAEFGLEGEHSPQLFTITVSDNGPGIANVGFVMSGKYRSETGMGMGLIGSKRLMDQFRVESRPGKGTRVAMKKLLPSGAPLFGKPELADVAQKLAARLPATPFEESQQQNRELIKALEELRQRQEELLALNQELEDTNRGVVALYAELDEKAEHLRRADDMKSRFLSNMSHEFRTPLHSIRALSSLLLDETDGPLNGEQRKQVRFISKGAEDLTGLVDDLLDLAKIEAGKVDLRPAEFALSNLFSALRGMLRPLLVSDAVDLLFDDPTGYPLLYTDEAKVSQILRNFISNALKFTERGEVRVSAALSEDRRMVTLSVSDTGIGIAPEDQDKIFQEFEQVAGPLQKRIKGTGLGLPLCRQLAGLLGGTVTLKSEPGRGSVFSAVLPLQLPAEDLLPEEAQVALQLDSSRLPVLVVEDELSMRLFYERAIADSIFQFVPAASLRAAAAALRGMTPAAVLLDISLGSEDSWRWLAEFKQNPATAAIPVLVVTSNEDERKALSLGADVFLRKPASAQQLLDALHTFAPSRILVVDDDPAARYMIRKLLAVTSYHVLETENAGSGLATAGRTRPDIIVVDLGLPDFPGEELVDRLSRQENTAGIPIVVATSKELSDVERRFLAERTHAILSKRDLTTQMLPTVMEVLHAAATAAARAAPLSQPPP